MATIGVTGHRILSEQEKIVKSVDRAVERLSEKWGEEPMTLLTALAEGSDRLVASRFLQNNSMRVVAVLPLDPEEYRKDFATEESRDEFYDFLKRSAEVIQMPRLTDRNAAYEAAGVFVIDHCDALICIWDGLPQQGRGGTGSMMERARSRGIPIAWIHAGNREPGTTNPTTLGIDQGKITYENL